jgi:hypothetical protein
LLARRTKGTGSDKNGESSGTSTPSGIARRDLAEPDPARCSSRAAASKSPDAIRGGFAAPAHRRRVLFPPPARTACVRCSAHGRCLSPRQAAQGLSSPHLSCAARARRGMAGQGGRGPKRTLDTAQRRGWRAGRTELSTYRGFRGQRAVRSRILRWTRPPFVAWTHAVHGASWSWTRMGNLAYVVVQRPSNPLW